MKIRMSIVVAIAAFLLVALAPTAVQTDARASGAGGSAGASLTLTPNPVAAYGSYVTKGSGFRPNTWVSVGVRQSDTTWWWSGVTDGSGGFSFSWTTGAAGSVVHDAYQQRNNGRFAYVTSATLIVQ